MGKVYGREPAVWLAALGALWQILSAFGLDFSAQLQSIATAAVAAGLGLIIAVQVGDGIFAALTGLITAGTSLVSYFALDWSAETQAKFVGAVMVILGLWVRDKVTAPVPASVSPPGTLVAKTPVA
jgi:TM2 domain-containing membrane protein YozV